MKKNFIYQIVYNVFLVILPLVLAPYLSRTLQVENVGIYSYSYAIVNYFEVFCNLGIYMYGKRKIAQIKDNSQKLSETFWTIYIIHFAISLTIIIIYFIFLTIFVKNNMYVFMLLSMFLFSAMFDINWFFWGLEKISYTATRNIIFKIITFILIIIFVNSAKDLWIYVLIMSLDALLRPIVMWPLALKIVGKPKFNKEEIRPILSSLLLLFLPVISISLYKYMDKVMLGYMTDSTNVGIYEYSYKIIEILTGIITALSSIMLPRMSYLFTNKEKNKKIIDEYLSKSIFVSLTIGCVLAFGISSVCQEFLPFYFGNGFEKTGLLTLLMSPTLIFISWSSIVNNMVIVPMGMDKIYVKTLLFAAFINFLINLLLIPRIGIYGTLLGTVLAEMIVAVYPTYFIRKEYDFKSIFKSVLIPFASGFVMFGILMLFNYFVEFNIYSLIVEIIIGGTVFMFFFIILLFIFDREKYDYLIQFIVFFKRKLLKK